VPVELSRSWSILRQRAKIGAYNRRHQPCVITNEQWQVVTSIHHIFRNVFQPPNNLLTSFPRTIKHLQSQIQHTEDHLLLTQPNLAIMATRAANKRVSNPHPDLTQLPLLIAPAHPRICHHNRQPTSVHNRPPFRNQHPRMALHPHGAAPNPLPKWPILGHTPLPTQLPICSTSHTHAYALWPFSTLDASLFKHK